MKTTNDILSDIYKVVKASPIDALNGGIYKVTRPTNSTLNDCVIHLIPGTTDKFLKNGAIYVKLFYKDLFLNNTYSEDFLTGSAYETLLFNLSTTLLKNNLYSFDIQSREIYTEAIQNVYGATITNEHYAILKINFQI